MAFFDPLFELLRKSMALGFTSESAFGMLKSGRTPEELFELSVFSFDHRLIAKTVDGLNFKGAAF